MKHLGWSWVSLALLGLGVACSDGDPADDADGMGGAANGGQQSGGSPGSGGDASGGQASGGASGSQGTGGSDGSVGGSGGGGSGFDELYAMMERLCRPGGYVDVELDLPSAIVGGVGLIARSSDDVVVGEIRHLTYEEIPPNFEIHFSWPASAEVGVEVEASGVLLSRGRPEYNLCFVGKALVGTDIEGKSFHIVASDDVTIANDDGTCTITKVAGTAAFCVAAEF